MKYPTDLSDRQWALVEPYTGRPDPRGAVRRHSMREIINAILYVNKTGCQWRLLPVNFPPWQTVYDHFRRMRERGVWEEMMLEMNRKVRQKKGAIPNPHISSSTPRASKPPRRGRSGASTAAKK
jgi:putative transposase